MLHKIKKSSNTLIINSFNFFNIILKRNKKINTNSNINKKFTIFKFQPSIKNPNKKPILKSLLKIAIILDNQFLLKPIQHLFINLIPPIINKQLLPLNKQFFILFNQQQSFLFFLFPFLKQKCLDIYCENRPVCKLF